MSGVLVTESIPVITRCTINFEIYQFDEQQEAQDYQGRSFIRQIPRTQSKGATIGINSLVGSVETGFKDFGYEEFSWSEQPTPARPGIHTELPAWDTIIQGEDGEAVVEAGKTAMLDVIQASIPSFGADIPTGMSIPLASRLQRIETTLRWDDPARNQVVAYVQSGSDENFNRRLLSMPFVFLPKTSILTTQPRQQNESVEDYQARLAAWMFQSNVGELSLLMGNANFKSFCNQIYRLVFAQLKLKAARYSTIDVDTLMSGFDPSYAMIAAAAAFVPPAQA